MSIARNTFYYTLALIFQKAVGFVYFALIARGLGVVDTGRYSLALSITTIFAVFVDLGLTPVLIREVAKFKEKAQSMLSQIISLKALLGILTYCLVIVFVNILNYPNEVKTLVYIAGVVMLLDSFSLVFWGVFRGFQNLRYESAGVIIFQTTNVVLGLVALYLGLGVKAIMVALLCGSLVYFLHSLVLLIKRFNLSLKLKFSRDQILALFKLSLPFALAGVFARIYTQVDTIMLSKIACTPAVLCEHYVGWYGIASKMTLALQFIPLAFSASLFPAFAEKSISEPNKLANLYLKSQKYLLFLGLPISLGILVMALKLVPAVWGDGFLPAALPLQILMLSLIFLFLTFPNGALLNALNKQTLNTAFMGAAVIINVGLNLWLIPLFNMAGAAYASLVSTGILFMLGLLISGRLVGFGFVALLKLLIKPLAASLFMCLVIFSLQNKLNVFVVILIAALVYLVLAWLLKIFDKQEINYFKNFLKPQIE